MRQGSEANVVGEGRRNCLAELRRGHPINAHCDAALLNGEVRDAAVHFAPAIAAAFTVNPNRAPDAVAHMAAVYADD